MIKKILFLIVTMFIAGCSGENNNYSNNLYNDSTQSCITPYNPYSNGSGHYAGYEWAEEKGRICSGNSNSFIEGCEEYYSQLDDYEACKR